MIIAKVADKCDISFFVKNVYLWSTLDSIFPPHWTPYDVYTKHFFLVIGVRVDFHCRVIFQCVGA